jgi:SAM-dependent methyltransferase
VPEPNHALHIVDVGCGGGDMLRRIERWAAQKRVSVKLTGVDLNPNAIRAAREFTRGESRIEWVAGEAHSLNPDSVRLMWSSALCSRTTLPTRRLLALSGGWSGSRATDGLSMIFIAARRLTQGSKSSPPQCGGIASCGTTALFRFSGRSCRTNGNITRNAQVCLPEMFLLRLSGRHASAWDE